MLSSAWMRYCLILWTLDVHLCSRSPQGERGLKYGVEQVSHGVCQSLPARGAWIEIGRNRQRTPAAVRSLPARGAWIEIVNGVSGVRTSEVAPRKGSVD